MLRNYEGFLRALIAAASSQCAQPLPARLPSMKGSESHARVGNDSSASTPDIKGRKQRKLQPHRQLDSALNLRTFSVVLPPQRASIYHTSSE